MNEEWKEYKVKIKLDEGSYLVAPGEIIEVGGEMDGKRTVFEIEGLKVKEKEMPVEAVNFIEATEDKGKQRFYFKTAEDAEMAGIVFGKVLTGKYEFASPVNFDSFVRGVLRRRGAKYGTAEKICAIDTDNAWLLQQFFSWLLEGTMRVTAVRWAKEDWVDVEWEKPEMPIPVKEYKIYKVEEERIDGRTWRIVGEEKP